MNNITKKPIQRLGYDFLDKKYIPRGKDEYYLRDQQNAMLHGQRGEREYRHLSAKEIETLVQNNNTSEDWNKILVTGAFDAGLVKHCHFYGLVRIGKLEPYFLEFHNLQLPVGLYNSTICSCDFGDNVVVDNVNFIAHYIIGDEVILVNVNEMSTSPHAKFGNGILKDGEPESVRIWLELCNENGGRRVLPFEGMLPGDAFLWSKYRGDEQLMRRFLRFTEQKFDTRRGYYGQIGDRCIIKNCKIIKDTMIGSEAYLKGANKIKNITINSSREASTQIGEGCELVNGIVGYGCRIFYGVKAVRFMMASHSNLKYGARLINSYMGSNATVSCCEVLNSLIFPAHEQHHNNSFLCAALVMGQSNMAAGATIGSNHNSRGADGEIIAARGFWPGLCVSLKHNSRFATFALIAKGDYPFEINLPLPFSLVINEVSEDKLVIMPGYWFMHNMYALARNAWKHPNRDKRTDRTQHLEYDYLAPDSVEEMMASLDILSYESGRALLEASGAKLPSAAEIRRHGKEVLENDPDKLKGVRVLIQGVENSKRPVEIIKVARAYEVFRRMILYYAAKNIVEVLRDVPAGGTDTLLETLAGSQRSPWVNVGGQLMPEPEAERIRSDTKHLVLKSWDDIHQRYQELGQEYATQKLQHAVACLTEIRGIAPGQLDTATLCGWLTESLEVSAWIEQQVTATRAKDYKNPFRTMVYTDKKEMESVVGKLSDDSFIRLTREMTADYRRKVSGLVTALAAGAEA